jgi:Ca2+-binding RTX toxin-like protein
LKKAMPAKLADLECFGRPVTIVGTSGADRLEGTKRGDVIVTRGGDDVVVDLNRSDRVCTGAGNDTVRITSRNSWAKVDLGVGDDRFSGEGGLVLGGRGGDNLRLDQTEVQPGPGDDLVVAAPVRYVYMAACVSYVGAQHGVMVDLGRGVARGQGLDRLRGVHCLYGSRFADVITGSSAPDAVYSCPPGRAYDDDRVRNVIRSGGGNDQVTLCGGGDFVHLGAGRDTAMGGAGDDWVYGDAGSDDVWGVEGSDHLEGGDGDDRVNGTFYCDTASSAGTGMGDNSPNQVWGGNGDDEVTGDLGADLLDGGPGLDHGYGGPTGREGGDLIVSVERLTSCP